MVSFEQFVRPALLKMMGHTKLFRPIIEATLAEGVSISKGRVHLQRCKLFARDGLMMASATGNQSSGALRSMVLADGLMMLHAEESPFSAGDRVRIQLLDNGWPLTAQSPFE